MRDNKSFTHLGFVYPPVLPDIGSVAFAGVEVRVSHSGVLNNK